MCGVPPCSPSRLLSSYSDEVGACPWSSCPSDLWETDAQHILLKQQAKNVSAIYKFVRAVCMKDFPRVRRTQVSYSVLQLYYTLYCMYCTYIQARPFYAQKKFRACVPGTCCELKEFIYSNKNSDTVLLFFFCTPHAPQDLPLALEIVMFTTSKTAVCKSGKDST